MKDGPLSAICCLSWEKNKESEQTALRSSNWNPNPSSDWPWSKVKEMLSRIEATFLVLLGYWGPNFKRIFSSSPLFQPFWLWNIIWNFMRKLSMHQCFQEVWGKTRQRADKAKGTWNSILEKKGFGLGREPKETVK